jgi:2-keto-3-deoxy-L-rhamnonate aldolase RhmA
MKNLLKEKLNRGETVIGTFVGLGHSDVTEVLSRIGFDWLLLDGEHSPMSFETMQQLMQPMNGSNCTPIVRPQWNDMVIIKRVLDIGAHGVLVPWVNTREEAEYAVRACKYPPEGLRGCGPRRASLFDPAYMQTANDEIMVIVQIETAKSVANIDDIFSVKGVDACYIGPFDLALSMGFGAPRWNEPKYIEVFDKVVKAGKKWGKPAGMFAVQENIEWAVSKGFRLNTVDSADAFLVQGARIALDKARGSK